MASRVRLSPARPPPGADLGCSPRGLPVPGRGSRSQREEPLVQRGRLLADGGGRPSSARLTAGTDGPGTRSTWPASTARSPAASSDRSAAAQSAARTTAVRARPTNCAAVPAATTRPLAITTSREHSSASSMLWVVTTAPGPGRGGLADRLPQPGPGQRVHSGGRLVQQQEGPAGAPGPAANADPPRHAERQVADADRGEPPQRLRDAGADAGAENTAREKARFSSTVRSSYRPRPCGTYPIRRRAARDGGCPNSRAAAAGGAAAGRAACGSGWSCPRRWRRAGRPSRPARRSGPPGRRRCAGRTPG